jgi:hypothetical protein
MKPEMFNVQEMEELTNLISWAVNGTEHGVMSYEGWKERCLQLRDKLRNKGYKPHGQWTTLDWVNPNK